MGGIGWEIAYHYCEKVFLVVGNKSKEGDWE